MTEGRLSWRPHFISLVAYWHIASFRCDAEFGRYRRIADMGHAELIAAQAVTPLIRKSQPYNKRTASKGIWVEPELLAKIEYRAKSAEGKVRHPFFKGLREDLGDGA